MIQKNTSGTAASAQTTGPAVQMMISYAHKDESLRKAFEEHLAILKQHRVVDIWTDRIIRAGQRWDGAIRTGIDNADIVLLMVSPAFFASRYINDVELTRALELERAGKLVVVPIILREGLYQPSPFAHLKELPTDGLANGRSVTGKRWKNQAEAFRNVTEGLYEEIKRLRGRRLEEHAVRTCEKKQASLPTTEDRAEMRELGATFSRAVIGRRVLWVDDHPENNELEVATLRVLGVEVTTETTTEKAMRALRSRGFDLVLSDWERDPRKEARISEGMRLLRAMRAAHMFVPLIFYSAPLPPERLARRRWEVAKAGGSGYTGAPQELIRWTIGELVRSAAFDSNAPFTDTPLYPEQPRQAARSTTMRTQVGRRRRTRRSSARGLS